MNLQKVREYLPSLLSGCYLDEIEISGETRIRMIYNGMTFPVPPSENEEAQAARFTSIAVAYHMAIISSLQSPKEDSAPDDPQKIDLEEVREALDKSLQYGEYPSGRPSGMRGSENTFVPLCSRIYFK